jgi:hypothetical protein
LCRIGGVDAQAEAEAAIDALYRGPLEDFIGARKALAARLRGQGLAELARQVAAQRKPSRLAWAVNQVVWHEPACWQAWCEAVAAVRRVQEHGEGVLATVTVARRRALDELGTATEARLAAAGHGPLDPATRRRLEAMWIALGDAASVERPGRLTADPEPVGFSAFAGTTPSAPVNREAEDRRLQASAAIAAAEERVANGEENLARAEDRVARAQADLELARRAQTSAAAELAAAREDLQARRGELDEP